MGRRIHPRHITDTVAVEPFTETGWVGEWGPPETVRCQVELTRQLVQANGAVTPVTLTTLRVPPDTGRNVAALFPLHSKITADGDTSWVSASREIRRQGVLVYLEVTTGDRLLRFGGTWPVDVVIHRSGGRDEDGDPIPAVDEALPGCLIRPGESEEPLDLDETALTTATLIAPPGTRFAATDQVTVTGSPLAGRYALTGEPAYFPDRTEVALRRIR